MDVPVREVYETITIDVVERGNQWESSRYTMLWPGSEVSQRELRLRNMSKGREKMN